MTRRKILIECTLHIVLFVALFYLRFTLDTWNFYVDILIVIALLLFSETLLLNLFSIPFVLHTFFKKTEEIKSLDFEDHTIEKPNNP